MSEEQNPTSGPEKSPPDETGGGGRSTTQTVINVALWSVLVIAVIGMFAGKSLTQKVHPPMPFLFHSPAFTLIDQDGKPFSDADLRGKPYICDVIFTTCGSACPVMSHKLAAIQSQTPAGVQLVSFTVNPEHDTPAVLKEYAQSYGADLTRWHFLTGTPAQMSAVIRGLNFSATAATDKDPIGHSEFFLLVDADGNIRGIYDSNDKEKMQSLPIDATWLFGTPGGRGW